MIPISALVAYHVVLHSALLRRQPAQGVGGGWLHSLAYFAKCL